MPKPLDHALRFCHNCQDNTCCRSVNGGEWRCKRCDGAYTGEPIHLMTYHELQARDKYHKAASAVRAVGRRNA